jgi:chromodomain-helicase-DNA-binding protein 7
LLTGTPIQNNMEELWVLLNFVEPVKFASQPDFMKLFGSIESDKDVQGLNNTLRP